MSENRPDLGKLKDTIQDSNINFLIGSGLSRPFLSLLSNIEELLTELDKREDIEKDQKNLIKASLYRRYFDDAIVGNLEVLEGSAATEAVLKEYKILMQTINSILLLRKNTMLSKQVNIFTTNVDIFLEKTFEDLGLECNDGFSGKFTPIFNFNNFKKSTFKKSLQYDNTSEIPAFNLLKLHGSLTWAVHEVDGIKKIRFSSNLDQVRKIKDKKLTAPVRVAGPTETLTDLITATAGQGVSKPTEAFIEAYQEIPVINPTKEKFRLTLLNQTHYELLRIFANELEKENTVLFVLGFSFADEHIREIAMRAINSNPTLTVYIVAHSTASKESYETLLNLKDLKNRNIKILTPNVVEETGSDEFSYDLAHINSDIFVQLLKKIEKKREEPETV